MLGFASRYVSSLHTTCAQMNLRTAATVSAIERFSSTHFYEEVDRVCYLYHSYMLNVAKYEVETGNSFSTFSVEFAPSWSNANSDQKKLAQGNLPITGWRREAGRVIITKKLQY